MKKNVQGVYAIIDHEVESPLGPIELCRAVIMAGVRVVQLRAKKLSSLDFYELAKQMRELCRPAGAVFIVNDRLDIALSAGADGVHLGQDDLPLAEARKIAGEKLIIGISTHSPEEAIEAQKGGADYIGFGAVYKTGTKTDVTAPQGPEKLREISELVKIPVIAIGGIGLSNLKQVRLSGAAGAALISGIARTPDPGAEAASLVREWGAPG